MLFTPETIAKVCQSCDALLCMPDADANPTVILEAAAWGLRVYASRESGYDTASGMVLPLRKDDMRFNVDMMRHFQREDDYTLAKDSEFQRLRVERDYTFDKMCRTIWAKVEMYL